MAILFTAAALLALAGSPAVAHPGTLDQYGGHYERKDNKTVVYHFHDGKKVPEALLGKDFPSRSAAIAAVRKYVEDERRKKTDEKPQSIELAVQRVIEVDVFRLQNGRLVRLMGLVRPKTADARKKAADRMRELIEQKKVEFEFYDPPESGAYWQGFAWVTEPDKDGKPVRTMANLEVAREGLCSVDVGRTGQYADLFRKTLPADIDRSTFEVEKVFKCTAFRLKTGRMVRLAGLEAVTDPALAKEGSQFVADLLEGEEVEYESCDPKTDENGTLLVFVWLDRKQMLNTVLIEKGYARPDGRLFHKYDKEYRDAAARRDARLEEEKKKIEEPKPAVKGAAPAK